MSSGASVRVVMVPLAALLTVDGALHAQALDRAAIDRISHAVVRIVTLDGGEPVSTGSGTVIERTGLIYTNRHVVEDGDDFEIEILEDPNEMPVPRYRARLVGYSQDVDFAVLQIDRDEDGQPIDAVNVTLPFLAIGQPDVQRGDRVYVFGYPGIGEGFLALTEGTVTTIRNGTMNDQRLPVWYQTDAQIAPGNSGGLAINAAGQIVGIPTSVLTEDRTGGRLGGILAIGAVRAAIDSGLESGRSVAPGGTTAPVVAGGRLDFDQDPHFGAVQLAAGFSPDPHNVELVSGGEVSVDYIGGGCTGHAAIAPDYRVQWTGQSTALRFFFVADDGGDTTLLVNQPDGTWVCNDDADADSLDPLVVLEGPPQGQYDVWVGSYSPGRFVEGTLYVTERTLEPSSVERGGLDSSRSPYFGSTSLRAGFTPDPRTVDLTAGGPVDTSYLGGSCVGFAAAAPDVRLSWDGSSAELRIFFEAEGDGDATILVSRPDGTWVCNDDAHGDTVDPMVVFRDPPAGQYNVWVGTYSRREAVEGTLTITELPLRP